jgi:hypothetical protein
MFRRRRDKSGSWRPVKRKDREVVPENEEENECSKTNRGDFGAAGSDVPRDGGVL